MTTRLGMTALAILVLLSACATPHVVRLDTGQAASVERRVSSSSRHVKVDVETFEKVLTQWLLEVPLTLSTRQQGGWVRASYPGNGADSRWQHLMSKSQGGLCKPGQRKIDCLSLLDDVMGLSDWDKLGVSLGLSFEPLKESISRAVEETLAPQLVYTVVATGLVTWAFLAANPEPVFTKAAAIISAVLLLALGTEIFLDVVKASRELKRRTDGATTWVELEQASQHFARRVGPEVARVLVLVVTMVVSHGLAEGAASLASRMSMLPGFSEATAEGAARLGISLAGVGQVSAVAVIGDTITLSLPATAVAVMGRGGTGAGPTGFQSWNSFSSLKNALGPAGKGKHWHHIVEQTPGNTQRFGPNALHNTENVIAIDEGIHQKISAYYSSKDLQFTSGQTVRQWLSSQSLQAQRDFGLEVLSRYGIVP